MVNYQYAIIPNFTIRDEKSFSVQLMNAGTQVAEAGAKVDLNLKKCKLEWNSRPTDLEASLEEEIKENCIRKSLENCSR